MLAGICAGFLLARRRPGGWGARCPRPRSRVRAGALVQAAAASAGGALGSGRLVQFGTADWSVGAVAAGVVAVGAVIGAAGTRVLTQTGRS